MKKTVWSMTLILFLVVGLTNISLTPAEAKTVLKMATGDAKGGTQTEMGEKFAELLAEYTQGKTESGCG